MLRKIFYSLILVILLINCSKAQSVSITSPSSGSSYISGNSIPVTATATAPVILIFPGTVNSVVFTIGSVTVTAVSSPYNASIPTGTLSAGVYTLTATNNYTDAFGGTGSVSSSISITITSATPVTLGAYAFSKPVILNTSSITGGITSTLVNFPALVYIQDNNIKMAGACADKVQYPNGNYSGSTSGTNYDFAFTVTGSSTELNYQVEKYDPVAGTLLVWVQIPSLTSSNTNLSFYFGSPTPAHGTAFTQATWGSDYQAVFHFNESTYTGSVTDATTNGHTGTTSGMTSADLVTGNIGTAYSFDGSSKKITTNAVSVTGTFTLSAWVKLSTIGLDQKVLTNQTASGSASGGYKLGIYSNNIPESESGSAVNRASTPNPTAFGTGAWHYIQSVYTGSTLSTYVDGAQFKTLATNNNPSANANLYIGVGEGGNIYYFNGIIDEARVSNVAKSTDWIKAEYYNQSNPLTFTNYSGTVSTYQTNAAAISGALTYTWSGATSADPSIAGNWNNTTSGTTGQLPAFTTGTSTLVIPAGLARYPAFTADASLYGLTIASGASLSLNGHTLSVGCNIYNNASTGGTGILNAGSSSSGITWNGSLAAQIFTGANTVNTAELGNMTVNNSAGGTITLTGGPVDIYNQLTITKGNLVVNNSGNGALTLKSTSTLTAGVAAIPSSYSITGTVNVERYITGGAGYRGYRILSSPVNAGTVGINKIYSINYLINSTFLTGTDGAAGGFNKTGNPSLYLYRENMTPLYTTFLNSNNRGIKNISGSPGYLIDGDAGTFNIPIGDGFLFFFRGGLSTVNPYTSSSTPVAATLSASGTLNQGNVQVSNWYNAGSTTLGYTAATPVAVRGLNMVGNPYASSIDWSGFYNATPALITIPSANVGPTVWELKSGTNTYGTYNALTGAKLNGGDNIIGSGEGFFIQTLSTGAATLKFTESAKISSQRVGPGSLASAYAAKTAYGQYMILTVAKDTTSKSAILIGFNPGSTKNYSQVEDDRYLSGQMPQSMWITSKDSIKLVSKWLTFPKAKQTDTANITVTVQTSGQYTLTRSDFKAIPNLYNVWLLDNYKKDSLDIKHNDKYIFDVDLSDAASYGSNRFQVVIREDPALGVHLLDFAAAKAAGGAQLTWKTENEADYTGFTVERSTDNGKTFDVLGGFVSNDLATYNFTDKNPLNNSTNWYRLKLEDLDGIISYSKTIPLMYSKSGNTIANNNISIYPNPTKGPITIAVAQSTLELSNPINTSYNIIITGSNGTIVKKAVSSQAEWQGNLAGLLPGSYVVQVTNNTDKSLVGKGKFVKL